jgi:hypothetical protein
MSRSAILPGATGGRLAVFVRPCPADERSRRTTAAPLAMLLGRASMRRRSLIGLFARSGGFGGVDFLHVYSLHQGGPGSWCWRRRSCASPTRTTDHAIEEALAGGDWSHAGKSVSLLVSASAWTWASRAGDSSQVNPETILDGLSGGWACRRCAPRRAKPCGFGSHFV